MGGSGAQRRRGAPAKKQLSAIILFARMQTLTNCDYFATRRV
jgi:hypothetical protein